MELVKYLENMTTELEELEDRLDFPEWGFLPSELRTLRSKRRILKNKISIVKDTLKEDGL